MRIKKLLKNQRTRINLVEILKQSKKSVKKSIRLVLLERKFIEFLEDVWMIFY